MRTHLATIALLMLIGTLFGSGLLLAQETPGAAADTQPTPTPETREMMEAKPEATLPATPPPLTENVNYTVVRGDRLLKIAERYGVSLACLARANRIANPNRIFIGQQLIIPASCQGGGGGDTGSETLARRTCQFDRNAGRVAQGGSYTVQLGDTLDFIACDFNVSLACLAAANPQLSNRGRLQVGQALAIDLGCPAWDGPPGPGDQRR